MPETREQIVARVREEIAKLDAARGPEQGDDEPGNVGGRYALTGNGYIEARVLEADLRALLAAPTPEPVAWVPMLEGVHLMQYAKRERAEVEAFCEWRRTVEDGLIREREMHAVPLYAAAPVGDARSWECWVNVYPDGTVMPYTGEAKARQMRSTLTDVETIHARVTEIPDAARSAFRPTTEGDEG